MTLAPQPPSLPQPPSGPPSGPPLPNVPRPATGLRIEVEYPALIGYVPASFGQRAGAVIVDSVVSTCVIAAAFGLASIASVIVLGLAVACAPSPAGPPPGCTAITSACGTSAQSPGSWRTAPSSASK